MYDKSWKNISIYPGFAQWITLFLGNQLLARCNYCKHNTTNFSSMGIPALKSHYKGAKHLKPTATISNAKTII